MLLNVSPVLKKKFLLPLQLQNLMCGKCVYNFLDSRIIDIDLEIVLKKGIVSFTIGFFEEFNSIRVQGKKLLGDFNERNQDLS